MGTQVYTKIIDTYTIALVHIKHLSLCQFIVIIWQIFQQSLLKYNIQIKPKI